MLYRKGNKEKTIGTDLSREERVRIAASKPEPHISRTMKSIQTLRKSKNFGLNISPLKMPQRGQKIKRSRSFMQNQSPRPDAKSSRRSISKLDGALTEKDTVLSFNDKSRILNQSQYDDLSAINQQIEESSSKIKSTIKNITSFFGFQDPKFDKNNTSILKRTLSPIIYEPVKQNPAPDTSNLGGFLEEIKTQIQEKEQLLNSRRLKDNREAKRKYINYGLRFNNQSVEEKERILKGDDFNISELDSVADMWKKTSNAIRKIDEKENQNIRILRNEGIYSLKSQAAKEQNKVKCLQSMNIVNEFDFDEEEFKQAVEENEAQFEERINQGILANKLRKKNVQKRHAQAAEKARSVSTGKAGEGGQGRTYFKISKGRSPNVSHLNTTMTKKEKELYEKELKVEMDEKMKKIDQRMENKKKYYEDVGVFNADKNEVRLNASRFVAVFKEKNRLQKELLKSRKKANMSQQVQDKSSLLQHEDSNDSAEKEESINYSDDEDWYLRKKEVTDNPLLVKLRELLMRPTITMVGKSKMMSLKVYEKRLNDLRRKYNETKTQEIHALDFTRLQVI